MNTFMPGVRVLLPITVGASTLRTEMAEDARRWASAKQALRTGQEFMRWLKLIIRGKESWDWKAGVISVRIVETREGERRM